MLKITYKNLYTLVKEEIDKGIQFRGTERFQNQLDHSSNVPFGIGSDRTREATTLAIIRSINDILAEALPNRIISGLSVTATDPISNIVNISAGSGTQAGNIYTLEEDIQLTIDFDAETDIYFITLFQNAINVEKLERSDKLTIAKIIVPQPGITNVIRDKNDGSYDAYIIQLKEIRFFADDSGIFEENSLEIFRDNIGDILADNLIGNIRLSENLKIINTQGTLELDSSSLKLFDTEDNNLFILNNTGVYFYNALGVELAKFAVDGARVGNISVTTNSIESVNFLTNFSGFRILDNGNAEFNDVKLRGTLFTSTISENIFIQEGVDFIGDLNLFDSDITLQAGHKLIFDKDRGSDTYWVYNPETMYLEGWVDGQKRIEL